MQYDHVIQQVPSATPTQRSAIPFCHGLRKAVRTGVLSKSLAKETASPLNFESWLNSRNLCAGSYGQVSLSCCTIPRALGFLVTFRHRILRRSWPITKKLQDPGDAGGIPIHGTEGCNSRAPNHGGRPQYSFFQCETREQGCRKNERHHITFRRRIAAAFEQSKRMVRCVT